VQGVCSSRLALSHLQFAELWLSPSDAGLLLVAAYEDGRVRIMSSSYPRLGHDTSSWPCLYSFAVPKSATQHAGQCGKRCITLSWQPQPHAQQLFLAVATSNAVSVWCFDQCASCTLSCLHLGLQQPMQTLPRACMLSTVCPCAKGSAHTSVLLVRLYTSVSVHESALTPSLFDCSP
jgi:hypothetical protein